MIVSIEYDDGKPVELKGKTADDRGSYVTPRGRNHGFYVRFPNGEERHLPIGYMRISEMQKLETIFNEMVVNL